MIDKPRNVPQAKSWVTGLRCRRAHGDRCARSESTISRDVVVVVITIRSNPLLTSTAPEPRINQRGCIDADRTQFGRSSGAHARETIELRECAQGSKTARSATCAAGSRSRAMATTIVAGTPI